MSLEPKGYGGGPDADQANTPQKAIATRSCSTPRHIHGHNIGTHQSWPLLTGAIQTLSVANDYPATAKTKSCKRCSRQQLQDPIRRPQAQRKRYNAATTTGRAQSEAAALRNKPRGSHRANACCEPMWQNICHGLWFLGSGMPPLLKPATVDQVADTIALLRPLRSSREASRRTLERAGNVGKNRQDVESHDRDAIDASARAKTGREKYQRINGSRASANMAHESRVEICRPCAARSRCG